MAEGAALLVDHVPPRAGYLVCSEAPFRLVSRALAEIGESPTPAWLPEGGR